MALKDHLEKLHYFFQVAKSGSIKEASSVLNLTQPSISKSIKILEESLEKKLFIRLPRGVKPTKEGELLLKYCQTLFSQLEDVEAKLNSPDDPMAGHLKVGTYDSIAIYFWPKFLLSFLKEHPNFDLELTTGRSLMIQKKVENGELDLGLIIEPKESAQVNVVNLYTDTFKLYTSSKKNIAPSFIYMPDALAGENQSRLNHLLSSGESQKKVRHYKTSSLESAKELVIKGLGTGLLPNMVAQDALKKKQIVQIESKGFPKTGIGKHKIGLVYPKEKKDSPLMQKLIKTLKSQSWDDPF